MAVSNEIIEKIRLSVDIAELVREYVPTMKKAGRNWKALCPFHNEKTPSFMVSPEKGIFHCFGCHAGGDVFKFMMLIESLSWIEAVKKLGARAGITIEETKEDVLKRSEKQKLYDILEKAAEFYHKCFLESKDAEAAREYAKKRGLTMETIKKFRIGFAPKNLLVAMAAKNGTTPEMLKAAGIVTKTERGNYYEYMTERFVFPITDTHGRVVAFGGRTLKDEQPKYINSPETQVYSKSANLYGLFQGLANIRQNKEVIILEGYMDVVTTHQFGASSTVASLGTSFTAQHSNLLKRYAETIILMYDSDNAGRNAAYRAATALVESEIPIRVVFMPDNMDPDEYILKHGKKGFDEFIEKNAVTAIEFLTQYAVAMHGNDTPERKSKTIGELIPIMLSIKNAVMRHEWIRAAASAAHTLEEAVMQELKKRDKPSKRSEQKQPATIMTNVRSAEEELLQVLANHPEFIGHVNEELFCNYRTKKVCALMAKEVAISDIINHIEEADIPWFTELIMEEKLYDNPKRTLDKVLEDMEQTALYLQRSKLEKEVVAMMDGKLPVNENKMQLYQELTKKLKGSNKIEA